MTLEAFGVKNLRCLTDTGLVPIRPITVLVGRNSSGKSTLLRAFPLLRQSVTTGRDSPVLWYHDRYVDFGSFGVAANHRLAKPSVTFQFRVALPGAPVVDITMTLAGGEAPHVSEYEIRWDDHQVSLMFDSVGRARRPRVDGRILKARSVLLSGSCLLLPHFRSTSAKDDIDGPVSYSPAWAGMLERLIHPAFRRLGRKDTPTSLLEFARAAVEEADLEIADIMSRVVYLAPLRVSAERAYRIQNLAVDEVDPDGRNLAMFLHALSPAEARSFADFTRDALGFETTVKATAVHAEILVKESLGQRFVNLVDVGFGFSEVLPLAAMLWSSCVRGKRRAEVSLIAVEQPELHLHPGHQAKLARMFVEAVARGRSAKILVETHSETLINGLGRLVYEGAVKAEDVQIVLFDRDEETGDTSVELTGYDADGALRDNWPYGFLSPVAERLARPAAE